MQKERRKSYTHKTICIDRIFFLSYDLHLIAIYGIRSSMWEIDVEKAENVFSASSTWIRGLGLVDATINGLRGFDEGTGSA